MKYLLNMSFVEGMMHLEGKKKDSFCLFFSDNKKTAAFHCRKVFLVTVCGADFYNAL